MLLICPEPLPLLFVAGVGEKEGGRSKGEGEIFFEGGRGGESVKVENLELTTKKAKEGMQLG